MHSNILALAILLSGAAANSGQGAHHGKNGTTELIDTCGAFRHKYNISCAVSFLPTVTLPIGTVPGHHSKPTPTGTDAEMKTYQRLDQRSRSTYTHTGGYNYTGVPPAPTGPGKHHVCDKIVPAHLDAQGHPVNFKIYPCYIVGTKTGHHTKTKTKTKIPSGTGVTPPTAPITTNPSTIVTEDPSIGVPPSSVVSSGIFWTGVGTGTAPGVTDGPTATGGEPSDSGATALPTATDSDVSESGATGLSTATDVESSSTSATDVPAPTGQEPSSSGATDELTVTANSQPGPSMSVY